jgi:nucleotide-binding universal stress UspA family protein
MSEFSADYGILVGLDGSPESLAAVRWAAEESVLRNAQVTLMHVIAPIVVSWPIDYLEVSYAEWQEDHAQHVIEQAQKSFYAAIGDTEPPPLRAQLRHDGIVTELTDASAKATMVVVGSRGLGPIGGALLGSVSRGLLHHAQCPVTIVKADAVKAPGPSSPVLLGIDGSSASEAATAFAFDEASRRGIDLVVLHAWSDVGVFPILGMNWHKYEQQGHEVLAERLAGWQEKYPDVNVRRRIVCDRPARWLIEESRQAQLVVVGSRGRGGIASMLLGSVSTAVAESASAPVIVVHG